MKKKKKTVKLILNLEVKHTLLPKGTNESLPFPISGEGEFQLLTAVNKWLIAHEDANLPGAFCGLKGENITLKN